jgi:hypothetical protein
MKHILPERLAGKFEGLLLGQIGFVCESCRTIKPTAIRTNDTTWFSSEGEPASICILNQAGSTKGLSKSS